MNRMSGTFTTEYLLYRYRLSHGERDYELFVADINKTIEELDEVRKSMTEPMYQGIANNEQERNIIKQYNKIMRHYDKLIKTLIRLAWCL